MTGQQKPIVYSIAGSDSSGGAGIQADLATFRDFGVHGCTVITALTAQNSVGVQGITPTPADHLDRELQALSEDMPPAAIKLGMLASASLVKTVGRYLARFSGPVVCDPVLTASVGESLLDAEGRNELIWLLPLLTLLTPNTQEAEQLTGMKISTYPEMEAAAEWFLDRGVKAVLITGGHLDSGGRHSCDYFSDGKHSFWLRGRRVPTPHTHGTGCTLSSGVTAALALGYEMEDAVVLGKMAVSQGLNHSLPLGSGNGPVAHVGWPGGLQNLPEIIYESPEGYERPVFARCDTGSLGLYPVVDSVQWLEKLLAEGVSTIQLRLKNRKVSELREAIRRAVELQRRYNARLFINDDWALAIQYGAYGVHLGQEDLATADIRAIERSGLRLGLSNHSWFEIARSHALKPSYMALGPIFHTTTKQMRFSPQGVAKLQEWVSLLGAGYPLTAIGGIDQSNATRVLATGVGSIAVVRAITEAADYRQAVETLNSQVRAAVETAVSPLSS